MIDKKWLAIGLGIAMMGVALGQGQMPHKERAQTADTGAPVTEREARATFKKVISNLHSLTGKQITIGAEPIPDSGKPVSREEVLLDFERIYDGVSPSFKFTPRSVWYDPGQLTVKSGPARKALEKLIKQGFVARACPLATSKSDAMSIDDFAYSVGFFVSRLADLTHMPDPQYTPILEPG